MIAATGRRECSTDDLLRFKPEHSSFVGIDSDGCVFNTMEVKQKRCMHGLIVSHWNLGPIEKAVRETAEFVNLHSKWRGSNRFAALLMVFELLRGHPSAKAPGVRLPDTVALRRFVDSGRPLGNPELEKAARETRDPELEALLKWSTAVNALIARMAKNIPPFPWALESLRRISEKSDAICVSQTPTEALAREWEENGIAGLVRFIAGQELGTKKELIAMATKGRYRPGRVLMIGDAPGDQAAARENRALFFPINPGREEASWERFHSEGYDRFLNGAFAGPYEAGLIREFNALLPDIPPWKLAPLPSGTAMKKKKRISNNQQGMSNHEGKTIRP